MSAFGTNRPEPCPLSEGKADIGGTLRNATNKLFGHGAEVRRMPGLDARLRQFIPTC